MGDTHANDMLEDSHCRISKSWLTDVRIYERESLVEIMTKNIDR